MIEVWIGTQLLRSDIACELTETSALTISVGNATDQPDVNIAGEPVPMVRLVPSKDSWTADPDWVDSVATEHLVGDIALSVTTADGSLHFIVRRAPSRITLEQYAWLVEALRARGGLDQLEDPLGRARIWLELAPDVPSEGMEIERIALLLFRRTAEALRRVASVPALALESESEWVDISRADTFSGQRVDPKRFVPWDPPSPLPVPVRGVVVLNRLEESIDTAENRFVLATVKSLRELLDRDSRAESTMGADLTTAIGQLDRWFAVEPWSLLRTGAAPATSFLLRDDRNYREIAALARNLRSLPELLLRFPPLDVGSSISISPWSLNVLYERWISVVVAEWLEQKLGRIERPRVPARGRYEWRQSQLSVVLRIDETYPRSGGRGVIAPRGKNRPDIAIEVHRPRQPVQVCVLDATYSRNPVLHRQKLEYALNLVDAGSIDAVTRELPLCCDWNGVAFPGGTVSAVERRSRLRESILSAPPSTHGEDLVHRWLEGTVGRAIG